MGDETVFVARNANEEERVERILAAAGIVFDVTLDAVDRPKPGAVCFLGLQYRVTVAEAQRCRELLIASGLSHGIV
jgi:hypothetical protein